MSGHPAPSGVIRVRLLPSGEPFEVIAEDDRQWVLQGRACGAYAVLSCSDRFDASPDYYPRFVQRREDLQPAIDEVDGRNMQAVLGVYLLGEDPSETVWHRLRRSLRRH